MDKSSKLISCLLDTSEYLDIYNGTNYKNLQTILKVVYSNIDMVIGRNNGHYELLDNLPECLPGDKSLKNSIDVLLHPYILLFAKKKCVTTSSCSGRIVILARKVTNDHSSSNLKKYETFFLKVSHSLVNLQNVSPWIQSVINFNPFYSKQVSILPSEAQIILKYEPFVIHVEFPNIDHALAMLEMAKEFGLKQSGLISARKRFILAIRGSQHFEAPIATYHTGYTNLLISKDTLSYYLGECNRKHTQNIGALVGFYWKIYYSTHYNCSNLRPIWDVHELCGSKYLKRWGSSSCIIEDSIYVFGGQISNNNPPVLSVFSIKKRTWVDIFRDHSVNSIFSCIMPTIDNNIAIIMGRSSPSEPSNQVNVIDISSNYQLKRVIPSTVVPNARFRHSIAPVGDNSFYLYGGITNNYKLLGDLWKGTIINNDENYTIFWEHLTDCPISIASSGIFYYFKRIFVIGGISMEYRRSFMDKIWVFYCTTSLWNLIDINGNCPKNRFSHSSAQIGNSIIVVGGVSTHEDSYGLLLFDMWRLDLDEMKWYYLGDLPNNNVILRSSIVYYPKHHLLYLIGGGLVCFTYGTIFQQPIVISLPKSVTGSYLEVHDSKLVKQCKKFCQEMRWYDNSRKILNLNDLFLIPIHLHGTDRKSGNRGVFIQCILDYLKRHNFDAYNLLGGLKLIKYERLGHVMLFNEDLTAFNTKLIDNGLDPSLIMPMYQYLASIIRKKIKGVKCIGIKGSIEGEMRKPSVKILFGNPITQLTENGIKYVLDVSKCMFSTGNVSERMRIPIKYMSNDKFELVVDMFCGIGYFSLPILCMIPSCKLVVTDINSEALEYFRKGLDANSVDPSRIDVISGDCRQLCNSRYVGMADRILLGLLPDSSIGWETAIILSHKTCPCMLHIHAITLALQPISKVHIKSVATNKLFPKLPPAGGEMSYIDNLLFRMYEITKHCIENGFVTHKEITLIDIVKVKKYSPHRYHYVFDLRITPLPLIDISFN